MYFLRRGVYFLRRGVYFLGRGVYFLGRGVYFLGRGVYFLGCGIYFLCRGVYFLSRGVYFLCRGVYFLGRGVYFLGRCVYCVIFIIIVIIIIVIVFFIRSDIGSDAYSGDRPVPEHAESASAPSLAAGAETMGANEEYSSSSAAIAEDTLKIVMSFLTMELLGCTMCGPTPGRTPALRTGEHIHIWCKTCAELPCRFHCAATHGTCPDCIALRTITQLSPRWIEFMWGRSGAAAPAAASSSASAKRAW